MILKMPRAVFWDWDGTLADSYGFLNDAHNHTLETLGFDKFQEGEYRRYFGKPREKLYPAIYKDKCDDAMSVFQKYVLENSHKIQVLRGSREVLELFHQKNITMGIVSNKKSSFIMKELEYLGWNKYFKVVIGSGDAKADKPSGAPLLMAIEEGGVSYDPYDVWYVGDTENDLACAKNVGCHAVFLTDTPNSSDLIKKYNPLINFESYSQLKAILVAI